MHANNKRQREGGDYDQPTAFSELVLLHDIVKKYHKVYM